VSDRYGRDFYFCQKIDWFRKRFRTFSYLPTTVTVITFAFNARSFRVPFAPNHSKQLRSVEILIRPNLESRGRALVQTTGLRILVGVETKNCHGDARENGSFYDSPFVPVSGKQPGRRFRRQARRRQSLLIFASIDRCAVSGGDSATHDGGVLR